VTPDLSEPSTGIGYDDADLLIVDGLIAAIGPDLDAQVPVGAQVNEERVLFAYIALELR